MRARERLTVVRDQELFIPILRLSGCVRDCTWDEFEAVLWKICDEGHQMVGLDLGQVCAMSSVGALLLRNARKLFAARNQSLTITALSPAAILAMS